MAGSCVFQAGLSTMTAAAEEVSVAAVGGVGVSVGREVRALFAHLGAPIDYAVVEAMLEAVVRRGGHGQHCG